MNTYINNLTTHLIQKNHYTDLFARLGDWRACLRRIKDDLLFGDIRDMSPGKLGEIMCSFEQGEVELLQADFNDCTNYSGDCKEYLREIVSLCLATVITLRIDREMDRR